MTAKSTKKKATKKTGNALAKQGSTVGQFYGNQLAAQMHPAVPLPDALKAFDVALEKVQSLRCILTHGEDEVTANRSRQLADAVSNLQHHSWTLRESAYAEADK